MSTSKMRLWTPGGEDEPAAPAPENPTGTEADGGAATANGGAEEDAPWGWAEWASLEREAIGVDGETWRRLTAREHPTDTDDRGQPMKTFLTNDLTDLAKAGGLSIAGVPVVLADPPRTLEDIKRSALSYMSGVAEDLGEDVQRVFRETVKAATEPKTVYAAGRQLQRIVAAVHAS